ncbi:excalibur calcium-binding domain-containing protein [Vibrio parahaemolyticus]|uniref:excalibur calcium-binding domain-containing protein n=1 Tax=Vibrio parahaemolyticus TaxID=670 RepID=UPI003EBDADEA
MKGSSVYNLLIFVVVIMLGAAFGLNDYLLGKYSDNTSNDKPIENPAHQKVSEVVRIEKRATTTSLRSFVCKDKVYCNQMSSCEEAQFYLDNCSGVKIDGDGDGIPCEKQHCTSSF